MHNLSRKGIAAVFVFALMTFVRVPAFAQVDFSGEWTPNGNEDSIGNPYVGDWLGIPMNDASRARAEAWSASAQTLPEWQCPPTVLLTSIVVRRSCESQKRSIP